MEVDHQQQRPQQQQQVPTWAGFNAIVLQNLHSLLMDRNVWTGISMMNTATDEQNVFNIYYAFITKVYTAASCLFYMNNDTPLIGTFFREIITVDMIDRIRQNGNLQEIVQHYNQCVPPEYQLPYFPVHAPAVENRLVSIISETYSNLSIINNVQITAGITGADEIAAKGVQNLCRLFTCFKPVLQQFLRKNNLSELENVAKSDIPFDMFSVLEILAKMDDTQFQNFETIAAMFGPLISSLKINKDMNAADFMNANQDCFKNMSEIFQAAKNSS